MTSRIHRRKPRGKSMPLATARANAAKSSIRAHIEHVFAHQKNRFGLFIRTIGLERAEAKLTLANLAYNFARRHPQRGSSREIPATACCVKVGCSRPNAARRAPQGTRIRGFSAAHDLVDEIARLEGIPPNNHPAPILLYPVQRHPKPRQKERQ